MSSFHRLRVLVLGLWWLQVLWCRFFIGLVFIPFAPSLTVGSEYPLGGGGGGGFLFSALRRVRLFAEGFRVWHFDAQWSPGLANSV